MKETLSRIDLNGSWEFRFEEGAALDDVADPCFEATSRMVVPGCYDAMPSWYLKRGTGLYRRTFFLESAVKNAWLTVDGMGLSALFMVDGREIGRSALPYSRLRFETGPLAAGEHTLFAALDNRLDWENVRIARPYYDFYLYGGFYHGVSLEFDSRSLRVRTRDFRTGTVEIEAVGFGAADFDATLLFDGMNKVDVRFANGRATVAVPDFRLWSPASPNLHTLSLQLPKSPTSQPPTSQTVSTRFGIRQIEACDGRLWLNGEPLFLKGANRHESHPTFGAATPEAVMLADIQRLKALGGNFFRGAHYPQSQRFLDLCDENGVLVWEESLGWGNGQNYTDREQREFADDRFVAEQIEQTRLMVENSFNHPSVIIFAFMNEFNSASGRGKEIADSLIDAIRSYDSGRLVTFACNMNGCDISNKRTDIVSFNTYPGWIGSNPGSSENLKKAIADDIANIVRYHRSKWGAGKPVIVSEMGTCGEYGRHDEAGAQWTEEFEAEYLSAAADVAISNPEICGFTIWQFADCRSYHRAGGDVRCKPFAENLAGIFDGYRRPKLPVFETVRRAFACGQ